MAIAVLLVLGALLTSGTSSASPALSRLDVQAGDTLWTLAESHPVDGLTTAQVASLVAEKNGLRGGLIIQGQDLLVPALSHDQKLAAR
jgi:LysM repeat protein